MSELWMEKHLDELKGYSYLLDALLDIYLMTHDPKIEQYIFLGAITILQAELRRRANLPAPRNPGYVYLLQSPTSAYKIGRTRDPNNRMRTFGVQLPFEVDFICVIKTGDMYELERRLHERYADKRIRGEWFALDSEDVEYIKGLAHD